MLIGQIFFVNLIFIATIREFDLKLKLKFEKEVIL